MCPICKLTTDELRAVVTADNARLTPPLDELAQSPDHSYRRQ